MTKKLTDTQISSWASLLRTQQFLLEYVAKDLRQSGLPPLGWYDVLLELHRAPKGKLRLNEIGARVLLEKSNITRLVDRLEKEKLLRREQCQTDRRGAWAVINPAGRTLLKKMWPVYAKSIDFCFASRLSEEEVKNLLYLTRKLTQ